MVPGFVDKFTLSGISHGTSGNKADISFLPFS